MPEIRATYRVQLSSSFTFDDAAALVPYLAALGVSHLYFSPYLAAVPGSAHGYDVTDHSGLNPELGGEEGFGRLRAALDRYGMGHIADVVPNHMALGHHNALWWEVLRFGRASPCARFFDIDWEPPDHRLLNKVLLPVLGSHYGRALEAGELRIDERNGELVVTYFEHVFPVAPGTVRELGLEGDPATIAARLNSEPGLLHALLERQHYRLAHWRTDLEVNYRRFFDINEMVALRTEDPEVFEAVHALYIALLDDDALDGLRIDHIDGLGSPRAYLERLRTRAEDAYIVVEKILGPGEELPADWPVEGTTGYGFMNLVLGLFVDPAAEEAFDELYRALTGDDEPYRAVLERAKAEALQGMLAADLERLTASLAQVCEGHLRHRDHPRASLRAALTEVLAALDVYRTYADPFAGTVSEADRAAIERAVRRAARRDPSLDPELLELIRSLVCLEHEGEAEARFVVRLQQTSGPAMAKGAEDTAFYRYTRFIALNEVGGDPACFGRAPKEVHEALERAAAAWPRAMLATATHDTKRGEDVRARLALLSEVPERWARTVRGWFEANARHRPTGVPDPATEYLLYQTLVGAYPLELSRALAYMAKASKEAKVHTSWTQPNEAYNAALAAFVEALYGDGSFMAALAAFSEPLIEPGRVNSLAITLIKALGPGIPDIYQGCEVWDLDLVDPDNRRPLAGAKLADLLARIADATPEDALRLADVGAPKLYLLRHALALRARLDLPDEHVPLKVSGAGAAHVFAFARGDVAVVVPRLVLSRPPDHGQARVELPPGRWRNVLTGEKASEVVGELFARFPVALLQRV